MSAVFEDEYQRKPFSNVPKVNEGMSVQEKLELIQLLEEKERRVNYSGIAKWYPANTPYSIDNLPKHKAYFDAGNRYRIRLLIGGNRSSKTISTVFEASCHATGDYPEWWTGRRWDRPVQMWLCGDTNETCKTILQKELLGPPGARGTGMLPKKTILGTTAKAGVSGVNGP